ncbi:hypothetical protein DW103_00995 [Parabacteroides sp. AM08-6]|nr:hypothetical protein DW103_00995 [Parabacteroides sp. AM08-6]
MNREIDKYTNSLISRSIEMFIAKQRLADTSLSINEIADELGFKYSTHFTRLFKKCVSVYTTLNFLYALFFIKQ